MEQFSGQGPDRAGDLAALLPELTRAARRMARAGVEPDDLVQETALILWRRLEDSAKPDIDNPRAYAHAILRKAAFKTRSMREEMIAEDTPEASCAPIGETRLIFASAMSALNALPPEQAQILRMRGIEGKNYTEIATLTGLPLGTVTSRLSRGRAALCARLDLPPDTPVTHLLGL